MDPTDFSARNAESEGAGGIRSDVEISACVPHAGQGENDSVDDIATSAASAPIAPIAAPRLVLHRATGHLSVRLAGQRLDPAAMQAWTTGSLMPQVADYGKVGGTVRQADLDLSQTEMTDPTLALLLRSWLNADALLCCPLYLRLHGNKLTAIALAELGRFIRAYRGEVRELNLTDNEFGGDDGRESLLELLRCLSELEQYPIWIRRTKRYSPLYLRIGHCGLPAPQSILAQATSNSLRLCLMSGRGCSRTACAMAARGTMASACPVAHLYGFLAQEPRSLPQREPPELELGATKRATRPLYLCGVCGVEQPLDMFGRHQFRKVATLDAPLGCDGADENSASSAQHLVRRCKECVLQPCSACGKELPLTSFARGQMLRPADQRRCRPCAEDTVVCVRCSRPQPREAFSPAQVHQRRSAVKVCRDCERTNPHFERRYTLALALGYRPTQSGRRHTLPSLPAEVVQRIAAFSEPGDEFIKVSHRSFECRLCCQTWSLLTKDVERHVRNSQLHHQRLERLARGSLLRIAAAGVEPSRLRHGLGVRGDVCSARQADEARELRHVDEVLTNEGLKLEALHSAGLAVGAIWVQPRLVASALKRQGDLVREPSDVAPAVAGPLARERRLVARHRWKLYGHFGSTDEVVDGAEAAERRALEALLEAG